MYNSADGHAVPSRIWYYLLSFNEQDNWTFMLEEFNKNKLRDLTYSEFKTLFNFAVEVDKLKFEL